MHDGTWVVITEFLGLRMENDERKNDLQESLLAHHDVKVNVQEQIIVDEALSGPSILMRLDELSFWNNVLKHVAR